MGLLAPHPRQHGMLHPKLRLTAQEKSNRKRKRNNAFSSVTPVFLFVIASALRGAHRGSGPATAGVWGRHQPPHPKTSAPFSKRNRGCFIRNLRRILCPKGRNLGLNALRLRGGMGAAQAPISEPHPLQTREAFLLKRAPCGMQHPMLPGAWGEQSHKPKPPTSKNLCANFPNIPRYFSAFSAPFLCP